MSKQGRVVLALGLGLTPTAIMKHRCQELFVSLPEYSLRIYPVSLMRDLFDSRHK